MQTEGGEVLERGCWRKRKDRQRVVECERGQTEGGGVLESGWWRERKGRQRVVKC